MKRSLVMRHDYRWINRLGVMLVLALATGCGKVPTWGELTGQQPAVSPPTTPVVVQPAPSQTPVTPVQPPKPIAAEVIARFKALPPSQITDSSLAELASLTEGFENLTEINATGSPVTDGGLANLKKLPALKQLTLEGTKVGDAGAQHLAQVPALEVLVLNSTLITDSGVAALTSLPRLKRLELMKCSLTPAGFAAIGQMPALEAIVLNNTAGVTDATLHLMCDAKTLKEIHLHACGSITDQGLLALKKVKDLEVLQIGHSPVTGEGLGAVSNAGGLKNLKTLGLYATTISERGAKGINSIKSLERLILGSAGAMNDVGLTEICQGLKELRYLNVGGNKGITGIGPRGAGFAALKAATNLEVLVLGNTSVNDAGLMLLKGNKKLKEVHLNHTNCTLKGIQALKKFLPDCEFQFADQVY